MSPERATFCHGNGPSPSGEITRYSGKPKYIALSLVRVPWYECNPNLYIKNSLGSSLKYVLYFGEGRSFMALPRCFCFTYGPLVSIVEWFEQISCKLVHLHTSMSFTLNFYNLYKKMEKALLLTSMSTPEQQILI